MTTRKANSAILDGIAGELAGAFDNTPSMIALTDNKLSKGRAAKKSRKNEARTSMSTTDNAASSETRQVDHEGNAVSRNEFTVLQNSVQTLAERMNGFLDRMEEAEDGPGSEEEDAARDEQPANEEAPPELAPAADDTAAEPIAAAEPAEADLDPLTSLAQSYDVKEKLAPEVHDQLAGIITTLCQKRLTDDVVKGKLAAYVRPANLPSLSVVKVNHEVWSKLSSVTRSRDIKIQRVTNLITQSMVAVTSVADNLVTATRSDETLSKAKMAAALTALVDGLALMANANQELNQRRREDQRVDMNSEFRMLCSAAPDNDSQLLYGADITARLKIISDTNRITAKLAPVTSTGHDTARTHGASYTRFRPYGSQRRPSWSPSQRGAFLGRGNHHNSRGRPGYARGSQRGKSARGRASGTN